jgi:hypothetical protein
MNRVLFRRIVCAVDLSEQPVPSLKRALQLAHLHGGELFVAHVTTGQLASTESDTRRVTEAFAASRQVTDGEPYHGVHSTVAAHIDAQSESSERVDLRCL